jgi:hypothetical protein
LADDLLGLVDGYTIYIDIDAAGHGWFVDPTPDDDSEFGTVDENGVMIAAIESPAYGKMDLLTVVIHEIGHLLGMGHDDPNNPIMVESLETGMRLDEAVVSETAESSLPKRGYPGWAQAGGQSSSPIPLPEENPEKGKK